MRPRSLKLDAAAATVAPRCEVVWIQSKGRTGVLTRDGATFVVAIGCAVPGQLPWWMNGRIQTPDGRSVEFDIEEHESEQDAMAVALLFLTEAPVPPELQQPPLLS